MLPGRQVMRAKIDRHGNLQLKNMPPFCVDTFLKLPAWLEDESPSVRERLLPRASTDPQAELQWRRYAVPELEHLFLSRVEIIRRDLSTLKSGRSGGYSMEIPERHRSAWLSALNGARHALFILHEMEPGDMDLDLDRLDGDPKDEACLRIALLGWLQQVLLDLDG